MPWKTEYVCTCCDLEFQSDLPKEEVECPGCYASSIFCEVVEDWNEEENNEYQE